MVEASLQENANGANLHGSIIKQDKWGNWLLFRLWQMSFFGGGE